MRASLLEIKDSHGSRVDLLLGLRGMDSELLDRARQVRLADATPEIVGRGDFIAVTAFAGGPVDLAAARAIIDLDRGSLDHASRSIAAVTLACMSEVDGLASKSCGKKRDAERRAEGFSALCHETIATWFTVVV